MKYYLDITLRPSVDIPIYFLWEKVYQQLHLALVECQDNNRVDVGVSFPEFDAGQHQLGSKLRLFSEIRETLETLDIHTFLSRLSEDVHITGIRDVPERLDGYAHFKRIQTKNNNARLARRKARREGISENQALAFFENRKECYSVAPFIQMKSHGSGKRYRLIIDRVETDSLQVWEGFSTYGLSSSSSVPLF